MTATESTALVARGAAAVPVEQVKELGTRVLNNRGLFSDDMTEQQAMQLAMVAIAYRLDPLAGEVVLYEGKPLVTVDGRIRATLDSDTFDGIEYTRPADESERKAFRVRESEDMWVAAVWRKGVRFPNVGYGRAGGPYERNALVKGSARTGYNPDRGPELARKRAIVNALRYLFPLPRPDLPPTVGPIAVEDVDDGGGPVIDAVAHDTPEPITRPQTQTLHALARELGLDEPTYRARLGGMFGVASSTELSATQAAAVIDAFTAEKAWREHDAPLTADVAAVREQAAAAGERVGDRLAVPDTSDSDRRQPHGPARAPLEPARAPGAGQTLGSAIRNVPHPQALDAYATALTRAAQLGVDLLPYEIDPTVITAAELAARHDNLLAAIAASEPGERLAGM